MSKAVILDVTAPAVPRDELVRLIAYHVTGGDPAAYLARLVEKEAAENAKVQSMRSAD